MQKLASMAKRVQIVFDLIDGEKKPLLEDCLAYYGLNQKQYFNACVDTIIEKATKDIDEHGEKTAQ